jgi:hypothetical protein
MMETKLPDQTFFDTLPVFAKFEGVTEAGNYRALPDDWSLATADIVESTKAIAGGGYKSVNMAGASVISALLNALDRRDLPFVFGGDGALVAFPDSGTAIVRDALSAVQTWVADELELTMRAAIVPMADIRARGLDVRVARYQASGEVSYAMFTGGGASWAEAEMKAGRFRIEPAPAGTRPDLTGLSCRWNPIEARRGEIVSIIAVPAAAGSGARFSQLVADIVALAGERGGHPVPLEGPGFSFPPKGLEAEARALAPKGGRLLAKLMILGQMALVGILSRLHLSIGRFDPLQYRSDVVKNSDFRKFDDGLKMTVDLDREGLRRIEERLEQAERQGICSYGLHRQESALMTCIVATPLQRDHIHFVDGAAGGYAMAATSLKAKASA